MEKYLTHVFSVFFFFFFFFFVVVFLARVISLSGVMPL